MAKVNQVRKTVRMDLWNIVRFQIATHCILKQLNVSDLDLNCLTFLALGGEQPLTDFCDAATGNKIFGSSQSVRSAVTKAEKKNLVVKNGGYNKLIKINPDLKIQTNGNILLDFKFLRVESENGQ
jgi:hypothetical protein